MVFGSPIPGACYLTQARFLHGRTGCQLRSSCTILFPRIMDLIGPLPTISAGLTLLQTIPPEELALHIFFCRELDLLYCTGYLFLYWRQSLLTTLPCGTPSLLISTRLLAFEQALSGDPDRHFECHRVHRIYHTVTLRSSYLHGHHH
jgi:hypothetical protein